ncbi:MAG: class I SAM-dependent methyltransferase [Candidatus Rokubacteria bacterium]|nr:class I SAM-dependent methyltransferase [Candidatus Rokubacteria bacterium]
MGAYRVYGRFYDATQSPSLLRHYVYLLRRYHPKARSLLEIACGTGANLAPLSRRYEVAGLDISTVMLRIARKKLPRVEFYRQDMARFRLGRKFDAIVCPYDSINHLLSFSDWTRTFKAARTHLTDGGAFIFDMNTRYKLKALSQGPAWVDEFNGNFLIMNVIDAGRGIAGWDTKIFERSGRAGYRLHHEIIKETSFPVGRVMSALRRDFAFVRALDMETRSRPSRTSRRVVFVCK